MFATYFGALGQSLGCPIPTQETFQTTTNLGKLDYFPPGETPLNWNKALFVVVQLLPNMTNLVETAMTSYNAALLERTAKTAELIDTEVRKSRSGFPVTYIEYKIGSGALAEHGIAVYGRHSHEMAALTKYVVHFGPMNDEARTTMKQLAAVLSSK